MNVYKDSVRILGGFGAKYLSGYLLPLREEMLKSNLNMLFEVYVGKMMFFTFLAFVLTFSFTAISLVIFGISPVVTAISALIAASAASFAVLTLYHSYPFQLITSKKASIEGNMPFAINHMGAIAASGVPPFVIFKLLASIPEYGEISNEAKRIVRNVDAFGMDITSAMRNVAGRTPSAEFRQFLYGVVAAIETGGDIKEYFENAAKEALFDYKLKREKYLQTLSTYADFYTAVLIAAPLFFVSILSILSLVGGEVMGMSIPTAIKIGVYVLMPLLNIAFILFIHYTQPTV